MITCHGIRWKLFRERQKMSLPRGGIYHTPSGTIPPSRTTPHLGQYSPRDHTPFRTIPPLEPYLHWDHTPAVGPYLPGRNMGPDRKWHHNLPFWTEWQTRVKTLLSYNFVCVRYISICLMWIDHNCAKNAFSTGSGVVSTVHIRRFWWDSFLICQ